jgi:hypothetical protein
MPIAERILAMGEEALRHDEMQIVFGAGHRDIEQTPLLLDLGRGADAEVGGNTTVNHIQNLHGLPFLSFGGVDGGEDEIILILQRHAGLIAGGVGRIEGKLGEEALTRRIAGGDLLQLDEIGTA